MKPELILEALAKLDPANKDHWTADGLPRLGAVGEGVTRQQIVAAAPFFSRSNPKLEEKPSDEELLKTLEDSLKEIQDKRDAALASLQEAISVKTEAERKIQEANDALQQIRRDEKARDGRTPTQINQDYLRACFEEKLRQAGELRQLEELRKQLKIRQGLSILSPADRQIAERVAAERKSRVREGKL